MTEDDNRVENSNDARKEPMSWLLGLFVADEEELHCRVPRNSGG